MPDPRQPVRVGVVRTARPAYPQAGPFHPSVPYPEYPFGPAALAPEENAAYAGVRELLRTLGYDRERFGAPEWNPLGFLLEPGMTVVLKPNFVLSRHKGGKDVFAIITHPAVLRAVADYCWIALKGRGRIIIADAPQYDCNFAELLETTGLATLLPFYAGQAQAGGPAFEIRDLRRYWSAQRHFPSMCRPLPGDPEGNILINLGRKSELYSVASGQFYGAVYHRQETNAHHSGERQEYEVSATILKADAVISIPKLKVHKKVGVTLNVKGLVGMATNKNLLVHYTLNTPAQGGDQFPDGFLKAHERFLIGLERRFYDLFLAKRNIPLEYLHRTLYAIHHATLHKLGLRVGRHQGVAKRDFDAGNWYGNDTAWRMAVDLMRVFHFTDAAGNWQPTRARRMFTIIDGIVGGENNGPLLPDPKPAGVLIGGENLLAADIAATRLMGYDPFGLRMYAALTRNPDLDLGVRGPEDIEIVADDPEFRGCLRDHTARYLDFAPHPGWKGHIEINPQAKERLI